MKKIVLSILFVFIFIANSFAEVYKYSYVCTYQVKKSGAVFFSPIAYNAVLNVSPEDKICLFFVNNIPTPTMYRMSNYKETEEVISFNISENGYSIRVCINQKMDAAVIIHPKFAYFLQNTRNEIKGIDR